MKIIKITVLTLLISIGSYCGYEYALEIISADRYLLASKIESLLNNRKSIVSGTNISTNGTLDKNKFNLNSGGFNVYMVKTDGITYYKVNISSKDLEIKTKYRQKNVDYYYNSAYEYLISQAPFSQGKLDDIQSFPKSFHSKYHYLYAPENQSDYNYEIWWSSDPDFGDGRDKVVTGKYTSSVYQTDVYTLDTLNETKAYLIKKKDNNLTVYYMMIGAFISILLYVILLKIIKKFNYK